MQERTGRCSVPPPTAEGWPGERSAVLDVALVVASTPATAGNGFLTSFDRARYGYLDAPLPVVSRAKAGRVARPVAALFNADRVGLSVVGATRERVTMTLPARVMSRTPAASENGLAAVGDDACLGGGRCHTKDAKA